MNVRAVVEAQVESRGWCGQQLPEHQLTHSGSQTRQKGAIAILDRARRDAGPMLLSDAFIPI